MKKNIQLDFKGRKYNLELKVCNNLEKFTGLMFVPRKNAKALLFNFKNFSRVKLHSWFVFFQFIAIWTDENNKIIDMKVVKPFEFSISPKRCFCNIIEIPFNDKYKKIINSLVGRKV